MVNYQQLGSDAFNTTIFDSSIKMVSIKCGRERYRGEMKLGLSDTKPTNTDRNGSKREAAKSGQHFIGFQIYPSGHTQKSRKTS